MVKFNFTLTGSVPNSFLKIAESRLTKLLLLRQDFMQQPLKHCNNFSLNFLFSPFLNLSVLGKARLTYSTSNIKLIVLLQKNCAESSSILCLQHTARENTKFVLMRSRNVSPMFEVLEERFWVFSRGFHLSFLCCFNWNNSTWSPLSDDVGKRFLFDKYFHDFYDNFFRLFMFFSFCGASSRLPRLMPWSLL